MMAISGTIWENHAICHGGECCNTVGEEYAILTDPYVILLCLSMRNLFFQSCLRQKILSEL